MATRRGKGRAGEGGWHWRPQRRASGAVEGLNETYGTVFLHWVGQWDTRGELDRDLPFSAPQTAKLLGLTVHQVNGAKRACIELGYIEVTGAWNKQRMVVRPPEHLPPMLL